MTISQRKGVGSKALDVTAAAVASSSSLCSSSSIHRRPCHVFDQDGSHATSSSSNNNNNSSNNNSQQPECLRTETNPSRVTGWNVSVSSCFRVGGCFPWQRRWSAPTWSVLDRTKPPQPPPFAMVVRRFLVGGWLVFAIILCRAFVGISPSLTLLLPSNHHNTTTTTVRPRRAATRPEPRSFRAPDRQDQEDATVPTAVTAAAAAAVAAAETKEKSSKASLEQLRENKKSTRGNHNTSSLSDSSNNNNNRTLPRTNQSSSSSSSFTNVSNRKNHAAKPKEMVLAGWPHEVWLRQKNRLHLWNNAYSMSAKHQQTRRALLQTYFTVVWQQSSLWEIQQLLNTTTTKGRSFQWLFPEHWNNVTALQEVYRRAALDVSENPLAIYYIEEEKKEEAISITATNRSKSPPPPPPRFRFDPLPRQNDADMEALNAFVARHAPSCAGKERWLRELQFAGALRRRTNGTAFSDAAICHALPTEREVQQLYGKGPIVLGLDRCEQYRRQLHTALRREMKLIPVHFPPRAKVAGLWNSGTTALSQSFVLNLHNYQSDAPIYVPTVTWGKHTPLMFRLKTTWPPGNRESRNHILPVLIVRDPYRWLQSMVGVYNTVTRAYFSWKLVSSLMKDCDLLLSSLRFVAVPNSANLRCSMADGSQ